MSHPEHPHKTLPTLYFTRIFQLLHDECESASPISEQC